MKRISVLLSALCLTAALAIPASAASPMEYSFDGPGGTEYGRPTSVETVHTADGGARKNEDVSKNAALAPPAFGSYSADTLHTGAPLTPNLALGTVPAPGVAVTGGGTAAPPSVSGGPVYVPGASTVTPSGFTEVTDSLYYAGGHLGRLQIPRLGVDVKVYEGTDSKTLAKGAGHFPETSIWDGNVGIAGHNRGANCYFGSIHTLDLGDTVTLTTRPGTRTYAVTGVEKVRETDRSGLSASGRNTLTLYTCVRDQSAWRWKVTAVEVV